VAEFGVSAGVNTPYPDLAFHDKSDLAQKGTAMSEQDSTNRPLNAEERKRLMESIMAAYAAYAIAYKAHDEALQAALSNEKVNPETAATIRSAYAAYATTYAAHMVALEASLADWHVTPDAAAALRKAHEAYEAASAELRGAHETYDIAATALCSAHAAYEAAYAAALTASVLAAKNDQTT
jgi:hypothetical protein